MVDSNEIYLDFLKGLHRISCMGDGADVCDRCGEVIWPEFELVRCDFCVGKHGSPSQEIVQAAFEKHKARIRRSEKESWDEHLGHA